MASHEMHMRKYRMFLRDAQNGNNSIPTRIEAYFQAAFHLIDAVAALKDLHINRHRRVRSVLESNPELFEEDTELVWRSFQIIENQIRPGQTYGGRIDGEALERTRELFEKIEKACLKRIPRRGGEVT